MHGKCRPVSKGTRVSIIGNIAVIALAACAWAANAVADSGECFGPWGSPTNLNDPTLSTCNPNDLNTCVNSAFFDQHPAISPNGLSLYITSTRPGGLGLSDIWVSNRTSLSTPWGSPQNLGSNINTDRSEYAPNISPDGHWLLFTRGPYYPGQPNRPPAPSEIWVSYREDVNNDSGWEPAVPLGGEINDSAYDANAPRLFVDEGRGIVSIYFNSYLRPGSADYDEYVSNIPLNGGLDLYYSSFPVGDTVSKLNSPYRDTPTAIRSDGLEMFITSQRAGGLGAGDLWVSTRGSTLADERSWSWPVNMNDYALNEHGNACSGEPTLGCLNTSYNEGAPALSRDGTTLYFFSDRPGGAGQRDLYVSIRPRVCDDD